MLKFQAPGLALVALFAPLFWCQGAQVEVSDICVYGGTSGGVVAAVAAARLGKSVSLVTCNNHVGGMTSGGLGVTDTGVASSIGGLAAEFYLRVGQAYGSTNPVYYFEPHVAESVFRQMLSGVGVSLFTNQHLVSVTLSNRSLQQLTTDNGTVYRAREFIDATYEGDLMAMAGVSFTWGRESSSTYGESLAGVQVNGVYYRCDPYVVPGSSGSGLLPLIQAGSPGTPGQGDLRVQTYNYRLCLTQNTTNQIPITAPANYSEATYELLHRYINAYVATNGSVPLNRLIDVQTIIPNGKTDINAYADVSTDYIGYNYTYPTNTFEGRQAIAQAHQDYLAGLLYYLGNSTNVPLNVRTDMVSWAYAKDEFTDSGGWPPQLYVREARRMVSDYVMQQQDAQGTRAATDAVALASYTLDCHPAARLALNGLSTTEGGIGTGVPAPYPVSYRSIVPRAGECPNLLCTFALSASHVGFASLRMEPVFMMTSHSAGDAAAFAIDDAVPVQQVSYPKLAAQLLADGQLLSWGGAQSVSSNGIILTVNTTTGVTAVGGWTVGANSGGWPLPNGTYWHDGNTGKGTKFVQFTPTLLTNGYYDVYLWWVYASNRATNTPVDVISLTSTNRVLINQQINCTNWLKIASSNYLSAGTSSSVIVRNDDTTGYVVANAVRWMPLGSIAPPPTSPPPVLSIVASDAVGGEFGTNTARFTIVRNNDPNLSALTVGYSTNGTAVAGVDYAALPGTVTIPAGANATNVTITPLGSNLTANQQTVTLTLAASSNYALSSLSNATIVLQDWPMNIWRRANFTSAELADPSISGDLADPDHDGVSNLMDYALGLPPKGPASTNAPAVSLQNGYFTLTYTRADAATDVLLTVEQSSDLAHWQSGSAYLQVQSAVDDGTVQHITVQLATPTAAAPAGFIRLRASRW